MQQRKPGSTVKMVRVTAHFRHPVAPSGRNKKQGSLRSPVLIDHTTVDRWNVDASRRYAPSGAFYFSVTNWYPLFATDFTYMQSLP